jgi:ribosomal protein L16/L10AE
MERFEWAVAAKTLTEAGRSLGASAWWFSECPDTSLAIRIIAERMKDGMGFDSNQMREQWRKGRQPTPHTSGERS